MESSIVHMVNANFLCRAASVDEIIGLRHSVLILGTSRTSPVFDGDEDPDTQGILAGCGEEVGHRRRRVERAGSEARDEDGRSRAPLHGVGV